MRSLSIRLLILSLVALPLAACARKPADGEASEMGPIRASTTVRVENRSFENIVVYVLASSGMRRRLGEVSGTSSKVFEIPRNMIFGATSLRFQIDPIGGSRSPISQDIVVSEGDQVQLTIP